MTSVHEGHIDSDLTKMWVIVITIFIHCGRLGRVLRVVPVLNKFMGLLNLDLGG